MPDSGLGGIRSALALISDSTRDISAPGRSAFRWARIPSRVYWIDNHRLPPRLPLIRCGRRVGPPGRPIQGSIGQTQTLIDHCFFGLSRGQLRDGIDLIQNATRQLRTSPAAVADPATGGPPAPAGPRSNAATRNGPKPTAEGHEPHPPETVGSDQHRSTIHRSPHRRPPPQRTTGREPHPPDRW